MRTGWAATVLALAGCAGVAFPFDVAAPAVTGAPAPSGKPVLTVVLAPAVARPAESRAAIKKALGGSFTIAFPAPPSAPPAAIDRAPVEAQLAAARKAYINADFTPCLEHAGEIQRVGDLLAEGERLLAERLLFWRIACLVGAGRAADARRDAAVFATHGLTIPPDVEAAAPDVDSLLAEAQRAVAGAPRLPLRASVTARGRGVPEAVLSVDGRPGLCVTPCTIDVPAGDHAVRLDADGYAPEQRLVRVAEPGSELTVAMTEAEPELAARQWTARQASRPDIDASASVSLLAAALRARSLAVVAVEPAPRGTRLHAALTIDGAVASRAERVVTRDGDVPDACAAVLRDLLLRGRLLDSGPPLVARPLFWVGVAGAALVAAGVTALLLYDPPTQVKVGF